uniref:Uncharacterized protein n=1 Tax=Marseillevirus LCMAC201 TaxID=2506605 RepID=A0A481YVQ3_9VIRU|nr:MAG: uncharacterized protein LCMAC201_00020 [Marseillevirus LCMAC201]
MEKLVSDLLEEGAGVVGGLVDGVKNMFSTEPDNINDAIKMHTERVCTLEEMKSRGFTSISEYSKYQEALEIVAKFKNQT